MRLADTLDKQPGSPVALIMAPLLAVALFVVFFMFRQAPEPARVTPISPETALESAVQEIVKDINYGLGKGQRSYPEAPAPGHRAAEEFRKRGWIVSEERKDGVVWLRFEWAEEGK